MKINKYSEETQIIIHRDYSLSHISSLIFSYFNSHLQKQKNYYLLLSRITFIYCYLMSNFRGTHRIIWNG